MSAFYSIQSIVENKILYLLLILSHRVSKGLCWMDTAWFKFPVWASSLLYCVMINTHTGNPDIYFHQLLLPPYLLSQSFQQKKSSASSSLKIGHSYSKWVQKLVHQGFIQPQTKTKHKPSHQPSWCCSFTLDVINTGHPPPGVRWWINPITTHQSGWAKLCCSNEWASDLTQQSLWLARGSWRLLYIILALRSRVVEQPLLEHGQVLAAG